MRPDKHNEFRAELGGWVDLHVHSTASDGSDAPEQVVRLAKAAGLRALALCDHDTTDGIQAAQAEAACLGMELIPSVELAAQDEMYEVHLLGYWIDTGSDKLQALLRQMLQERADRNCAILSRLAALGLPLAEEDVNRHAGGRVVSRVHMARAMREKGYVKTLAEAFDRYLGEGRDAYVPRIRVSAEEAIVAIRAAGGVPVLAHPFQYDTSIEQVTHLTARLAACGLEGLECYYSQYDAGQTTALLNLADRFGLAASGGSDYHGTGKPGISIGTGRENLRVPYAVIESLRLRRQ